MAHGTPHAAHPSDRSCPPSPPSAKPLRPPSNGQVQPPAKPPAKPPGRRLTGAPETEHGRFLRKHLHLRRLKLSDVAYRLRVSSPTLTRLMHGITQHFKKITERDLANAAEFDSVSRRQFMVLLAAAGITLAAARPSYLLGDADGAPALVRDRHADLDVLEAGILGWSAALSHDHSPQEALAQMRIIDERLTQLHLSARDPRYIAARIHSGMLLAALQEAVLPWRTQRPAAALRTYGDLEREVFLPIARTRLLAGFEEEYARLLIRRAVLLRESEMADHCRGQLAHIPQRVLDAAVSPVVRVAFDTQSLHTHALMMAPTEAEIADWRRRATAIRTHIEQQPLSAEDRADLHLVVDYTMGVGYKSVMWKLHLQDPSAVSSPQIERYAREASFWLDTLGTLHHGGRSVRYINLYHPSVSDTLSAPELAASALDALVWCQPETALARAVDIERDARDRYPAVLAKVQADKELARWRLGRANLPA